MNGTPRIDEILILKEIAELLNKETEQEQMLSLVLRKLLELTGLQTGWIFLVNPEGGHQLAAWHSLPQALEEDNRSRMHCGDCWCVSRFQTGKLRNATNIIECQRIEKVLAESHMGTEGLTHHATVPLTAGNESYGLMNVGAPNKSQFSKEELGLLESVALQIGTSLKRIRLAEIEREHVKAAERNRLAQDLHDSVNQLLFSVSLTARGGMERSEGEQYKIFACIQELAQEALGEMRALIWQLKPKGLEEGLIASLSTFAAMLGLSLETEVAGIASLPGKIEEALWRIGQEALSNCKKHAGVDSVRLLLTIQGQIAELSISDSGCGFRCEECDGLPSLGLESMRTRAEALGGEFTLTSQPGQGTTVTARLPY